MRLPVPYQRMKSARKWRLLAVILAAPLPAQTNGPALKLLITMGQPFVAQPEAARIQLHIHNASQQTVWLYRRAKGVKPGVELPHEENRPPEATGGSSVAINLQPAEGKAGATSPAKGMVLEYVDMPKPRLVKLEAGGDYEETSIVHIEPALGEGQKPIWGVYQLAVVYSAVFSNGEEFQRNLGAILWQGEVTSNTIPIELRPALPDSTGVLSGATLGPDLQPRGGIRVSLADAQGQLIDQQVSGADGRVTFDHLPLALYWVTGRRESAAEDTVTFHHEELTSSHPSVNTQLVLYPPEVYEAKKLVHKPALIRVFAPGGQAAAGISVDAVFSNGNVLDDVKVVTGEDGLAVMELLPGRSSVSLKRHGCAEQVDRADVAPGGGVEDYKFVFECAKK
jgi:hypothetical protein